MESPICGIAPATPHEGDGNHDHIAAALAVTLKASLISKGIVLRMHGCGIDNGQIGSKQGYHRLLKSFSNKREKKRSTMVMSI